MLFAPGSVIDFSNNDLDFGVGGVKTVVETHRIETVAKITQMGQQANRAGRLFTGSLSNQVAHRLIKRYLGITQVIAAPESGQCRSTGGPKPSAMKYAGELSQIQIHKEKPIAERVRARGKTPVFKPPVINRAVHRCIVENVLARSGR